jgi:hypothetical protein
MDSVLIKGRLDRISRIYPDEIRATKISSRWNVIKRFHWAGRINKIVRIKRPSAEGRIGGQKKIISVSSVSP